MGKTRLICEARDVCHSFGYPQAVWIETINLSYETNQAYGIFQRLIRRLGEMEYNDPPGIIREKLNRLVEEVDETRRSRARQVFEALFGLESERNAVPMDDETFRRELSESMYDWWKTRFSLYPAVLVVDDMHGSDAASADLLRELLPLTGEGPLVLLLALRSERTAPVWQIKTTADEEYHHRYTELFLHPLSTAEGSELINHLLAKPDLPKSLRLRILEKSDGNPFFIE